MKISAPGIDLTQETVNRFRFHRPTVERLDFTTPPQYLEYHMQMAAADTVIEHGIDQTLDYTETRWLVNQIAAAAGEVVPRRREIEARRRDSAHQLSRLAIMNTVDPQG